MPNLLVNSNRVSEREGSLVKVKSYDLFLDLNFKDLKFEGRVLIELEAEGDVVLNALGLNIIGAEANGISLQFEQKDDNLTIKTGPFTGTLEVEYSGSIPNTLVGLYKAPYDNTHLLTTQFEAANARRMFPCLDHPGYKASFKLALRIDKDLDALSNMPIESVRIEGDRKVVSFQKTPTMSTYLLYLGVGKFEEIRDKLEDIDLIVATTPGKAGKGEFALGVAKGSLEFYRSYFDIPYMLPKLHLIAVPEFAAGAMENWGAVTFREVALLVDGSSSVRTKRRVAEVVAHELAHQWFGNLVTMCWWDDLWLNESFATFVAYKVVEALYPEWKAWQDFLRGDTSGAMARDSLRSTHPIEAPIQAPSDIEQIFDEISYGKGASILRMIEAYLGAESFRKGIGNYLDRYRYSNATGEDLWRSLEEASGKKIGAMMGEWIRRPGYPLVTASVRGGKLVLRQERFLLAGDSEKGPWPIPVTLRLNGETRRLLLEREEEETIEIKDARSLKLNADQTGFYRVRYEGLYDLVWRSELSEFDRWGMISDALALLTAGKMPFSDYLDLVKRYHTEPDYLPSLEVSDQLAFLYSLAPLRIAEVSKEFHRSQLKILEGKSDENSSMLRGVMAGRLAVADESYAEELGSRFSDYERVEADMKDAVALAYARAYGNFEEVVKKYRTVSSDEEKVRLLSSMMSFREPPLVALSLGLAFSGEVKRQDIASMILSATRNPEAKATTWMWLKVNLMRLRTLYEGTGTLSRILLSAIPHLGVGRVGEVERFFEETKLPEAEKGIEAGLERLKIYDRFVKTI